MKKQNKQDKYEQSTIELGDDMQPEVATEAAEVTSEANARPIRVGDKVFVKENVKRFCDGIGVPDCARTAFVKHINENNNTVVIEFGAKNRTGVLFMSDITNAQ